MATTRETGLGLDSREIIKRTIAISGNRDRYFMDIIKMFQKKYPGPRIIYANNMNGAQLNPDHPTEDFIIIIKARVVDRNKKLPPKDLILLDAPPLFTERSIAGWTLAVEQGKMDGYFKLFMDRCLRLELRKFYEFLEGYCLLSLDPSSELYWKKPENAGTLTKDLERLYAQYRPRNSTKIQQVRNYGTPAGKPQTSAASRRAT